MLPQHPKRIVATRHGTWKQVTDQANPYTGKSADVMAHRWSLLFPDVKLENLERARGELLHSVLLHGAQWEQHADAEPKSPRCC